MPIVRSFLARTPLNAVPPSPFLGIVGAPDAAGTVRGVRVMAVAPSSPAEKSGLKTDADRGKAYRDKVYRLWHQVRLEQLGRPPAPVRLSGSLLEQAPAARPAAPATRRRLILPGIGGEPALAGPGALVLRGR